MGKRGNSEPSPNFAARRLRRIVAGGQPRRRRGRTLFFLVMLLAWLSLTAIGAYQASPEPTLARRLGDALYGPFTFLAPQDGYLNMRSDSLANNYFLWSGRFFGAALPVIAILWVWLHRSRMATARMLARNARGHTVIVAREGAADAIASCSSRQGDCVVLVEAGVSEVRMRDLAATGVLVVPNDADLAKALVQSGACNAARVLVWAPQDARSLADAMRTNTLLQGNPAEIAVRVESAETQRALRHAPSLLVAERGRLRPISITITAMRRALRDDLLVADARAMKQAHVCVALHGSTAALQVAAAAVLRHNWSIHLGPPRISCVEAESEGWKAWAAHHRTLLQHAETVLGYAPGEPFTKSDRRATISDGTITRHIVDMGNDDATLRAAFNLASELAQLHTIAPPVQPVLREASALEALMEGSNLRFAPAIDLSEDRTVSSLIGRAEDREAAEIHKDYLANANPRTEIASTPWEQLAETFVHANRAAADHKSVKQHDIGHARTENWEHTRLRDALARMEHDRWSMERLLDGWAPAKRRNNERLLHDDLVAWDALSEAVRQKDFEQIDKLLQGDDGPSS